MQSCEYSLCKVTNSVSVGFAVSYGFPITDAKNFLVKRKDLLQILMFPSMGQLNKYVDNDLFP